MADNSPVAQMYIEATDGGSLQKLAQAIERMQKNAENKKIHLGVDFSDFTKGDARSGALAAKLANDVLRQVKAQIKPMKIEDLVDVKTGQKTPAFEKIIASAKAAVPVLGALGVEMGHAITTNLNASLDQDLAKSIGKIGATASKAMAAVLRAGGPMQKAIAQVSAIRSAVSAGSVDAAGAGAALRETLSTFIDREFKRHKSSGAAPNIASARAIEAGRSFAESQLGAGASSLAMARQAGATVMSSGAASTIAQVRSQQEKAMKAKSELAKAQADAADRQSREELQRREAEKRQQDRLDRANDSDANNKAKRTSNVIRSVRAQQDAANVRRSRAPFEREAASDLEYMNRRQAEMNASAREIERNQRRTEAAHARQQERQTRRTESGVDFSEASLKRRFSTAIEGRNLYGDAAFVVAGNLQREILAEIGRLPAGSAAAIPGFRVNLQKASAKYTDPIASMDPEARQSRAAQFYESTVGSRTGQGVRTYELRQAAEDARASLATQRTAIEGRMAAAGPGTNAFEMWNRELAAVDRHLVDIQARQQRINQLEQEENAILQRSRAGYGGAFGRLRQQSDASNLRRIENERKQMLNPKQSSLESAHNMNFAMMNAAYGFQDFFQVLAQPGMGVTRAFLAAANNIGPALGILAGSAVGANVAVGALLAGMSILNMVMGKSSDEASDNAKKIKEMGDAYKQAMEARNNFLRAAQPTSSSPGTQGFSGLFGSLLENQSGSEGLTYQLSQLGMAGRKQKHTAGAGFRNLGEILSDMLIGAGSLGTGFLGQAGTPTENVRLGANRLFGSDKPIKDRSDLLLRKPESFAQAFSNDPTLEGKGREYKFMKEEREKVLAAMDESGFTKNLVQATERQEELGRLINIASRESRNFTKNALSGFGQAGMLESGLGIRGLKKDYISGVYASRQGFAGQAMEAKGLVSRLESDPEFIAKKAELQNLKISRDLAVNAGNSVEAKRIEFQISDLEASLDVHVKAIRNATSSVDLFEKQSKAASNAFESLALQPGMARIANRLRFPDDEAANAANVGGNLEGGVFGGSTGRQVNLRERVAQLKRQLEIDLEEKGLSEGGKSSLRSKYRKDLIGEVSGFAGNQDGRTQMISSGSLWERIQSSLTTNPSLEIEKRQLEVLNQLLNEVKMGKNPSNNRLESAVFGKDSGGAAGIWKRPTARDVIPALLRHDEVVLTPEHMQAMSKLTGVSTAALFHKMGVPGFDTGGVIAKSRLSDLAPFGGGLSDKAYKNRMDAKLDAMILNSRMSDEPSNAEYPEESLLNREVRLDPWIEGKGGIGNTGKETGTKRNRRYGHYGKRMAVFAEGFDAGGFEGGGRSGKWKRPSARDIIPALLRANEVVLTPEHQKDLSRITGMDVASLFKMLGVPGFDAGGVSMKGASPRYFPGGLPAYNSRQRSFTSTQSRIPVYENLGAFVLPDAMGPGGPSSPGYPSSGLGNRHPGGIPKRDSRGTFIGGRYYMGSGGDMPTNSQQMGGLLGAIGQQAYSEGRSYSPHKQAWRQYRRLHGQMTDFNKDARMWHEEEPFRERYSEYSRQSARWGKSGFYRNQGVPLYGRKGGSPVATGRSREVTNEEAWPGGMPFISAPGTALNLPRSGRSAASYDEMLKQKDSNSTVLENRKRGKDAGLEPEFRTTAEGNAQSQQLSEMKRRGMSQGAIDAMARTFAKKEAAQKEAELRANESPEEKLSRQEMHKYKQRQVVEAKRSGPAFDNKQAYLDLRAQGFSKEEAQATADRQEYEFKNKRTPQSTTTRTSRNRTNSWMGTADAGDRGRGAQGGLDREKQARLDELTEQQKKDESERGRRSVSGGDRGARWRAGMEDDRKMQEEGNRLQMEAYKKKYDELPQNLMGKEQASLGGPDMGKNMSEQLTALKTMSEMLTKMASSASSGPDKIVSAIEGSGLSVV